MRPIAVAALVLAVSAGGAAAALRPTGSARPFVVRAWEQHRALAAALQRAEPVYCGGGRAPVVALTFDDGPGPYTSRILAELRSRGAHATFFLVGNRIGYWPEAPRDETRVGAVGNHTWSHAALTERRTWLVWLELMRSQYQVDAVVGWKPKLFRPPYARHSAKVDAIARRLGLVQILWDVDARDDVPNARVADVVRNVERGLRPGAIVLLHDIHPWTAAAVPKILEAIEKRGLHAVSVPELLALDPPASHQYCPYAPAGGGS